MKKTFIYVLSAFMVASALLMPAPSQAKMKSHEKKVAPSHEKCVTGGAAEIERCKKRNEKKDKQMKKERKY